MKRFFLLIGVAITTFSFLPTAIASGQRQFQVGVARIDITPDYPVRLSGYAARQTESEGVSQRIWAKALAVGSDKEGPAILLTVDNVGVPEHVTEEVAGRLAQKAGLKRNRFTVSSSHTHSAPMLADNLPNLFGEALPPDQLARIERYTRELTGQMETVALAALADRKPVTLGWGRGTARFARNRRTPDGPVDHDVPVLGARSADNTIRALVVNYACHCTTLTGQFNHIHGDWAGYTQQLLEREHPGAIVLTTIGCGADQNPHPRPGEELARQHGQELADAVNSVLAGVLTPIGGRLECRARRISLPFDAIPDRQEWERRAGGNQKYIAYHAKRNLERIDRGERLQTELPYFVQTWNFGDDLAMVFLPGEVVVDYSLRLKEEFDARRLWVTAYANDVPCYIPSRRILAEGGYEAEGAMVYYDRPARLKPETEDMIINTVHALLPKTFLATRADAKRAAPIGDEQK